MSTTTLTMSDFESTIREHDIVLVDFWAGWCGPCRRFAPIFEDAAKANPGMVFAKVDTEAESALSAALGIRSIPTLTAFREGILVFSQPGALPAQALAGVISGVQALDMDDVRARIASSQVSAG